MSPPPLKFLLLALLLLLLPHSTTTTPLPVLRQQQPPTPVEPTPPVQPPTTSPSPTPSVSSTPAVPSLTPSPTPASSLTPSPSPSPVISPIFTPSGAPTFSPSPSPPVLEGRAARVPRVLSAALIAGLFVLLVLIVLVIGAIFLRRQGPSGPEPEYQPPPPLQPTGGDDMNTGDASRNINSGPGAAEPAGATGTTGGADGGEQVTGEYVPRELAEQGGDTGTAGATDGGMAAGGLVRGPTPPPHDYVLGAGPAATRKDFVELRTKFERDEIGDNSAVLGAGTGLVENVEAEEKREVEGSGLPDRGEVIGFDSQERLMAGGDGSGAISDVALSAGAGSIREEGGDVPSLERDPVGRRF